MIVISGTKEIEKNLGNTNRHYQCPLCHNTVKYRILRRRKWYSIYWIPIIPLKSEYFIACNICHFENQLPKEDALSQIEEKALADMEN